MLYQRHEDEPWCNCKVPSLQHVGHEFKTVETISPPRGVSLRTFPPQPHSGGASHKRLSFFCFIKDTGGPTKVAIKMERVQIETSLEEKKE